jgi:hypothetical protein
MNKFQRQYRRIKKINLSKNIQFYKIKIKLNNYII